MLNGKARAVPSVLATGTVAVGAGYNHTCAISAEGKLICWMLDEEVS